jgi:membrane dipeptidase
VIRREAVRAMSALAVGAPLLLRGRFRLFAGSQREYSARAVRLVEETPVVDMLDQFRFADFAERPPKSERWLRDPTTFTRADYETYRTSGIRVFALGHAAADYERAVRWFADWNGFLAAHPDWLARVDDVGDIERARREGKVGVMLTFQNSDHFRTPDDVDTFFGLGQRASQLTYNFQNRIGCGFLETNDGGLTVFGGTIVERMNRVGMAVDASHCADRTTMDAIAAARKPVIFSHASCRALLPGHLRCKTDEAIRAMARSGGVMGIPMIRFMIRLEEPVALEHVLDHVDHAARLVGVEHVGIGSDLDVVGNPNPVNGPPGQGPEAQPNFARYHPHQDPEGRITIRGLDHPRRVYDLTEGLIARRWSDADIRLILGGNWARVLGAIWPAPPAAASSGGA